MKCSLCSKKATGYFNRKRVCNACFDLLRAPRRRGRRKDA